MALSQAEQRVADAITHRRDALIADLRLHVGLATGGGNAHALERGRDLLTARARRLGATIELRPGERPPPWLFSATPARPATVFPIAICRREGVPAASTHRPILIAGHLDTVHDPAGPFQALAVDPSGARATGPGVIDMKGGLVIALAVLEALDECGIRLPWTLLLNSDEETGSYQSARAIFEESARIARAGGVGIAVEPAGAHGELMVERAGSGQFFIEVRGKAAHVGRDFASGISAVNALAAIITRAAALTDLDHSGGPMIVNIGPIDGGSATNVVPDRARAWGNIRFPTMQAGRDLETALRTIAGEAVVKGLSVEVSTSLGRPAKPLTPEVQSLAAIAQEVERDLGRDLPLGRTAGVCDGNIMQDAGLPTLDTLGVRGGGMHTTQEWIDLASLVERAQMLALFMMRASTGRSPGGSAPRAEPPSSP